MGLCSNTAVDVRPVVKNNNNTRHGIRLFFFRSGGKYAVRISRFRRDVEISESQETSATIGRVGGEMDSHDEVQAYKMNNVVLEGSCRYNAPVIVFEKICLSSSNRTTSRR